MVAAADHDTQEPQERQLSWKEVVQTTCDQEEMRAGGKRKENRNNLKWKKYASQTHQQMALTVKKIYSTLWMTCKPLRLLVPLCPTYILKMEHDDTSQGNAKISYISQTMIYYFYHLMPKYTSEMISNNSLYQTPWKLQKQLQIIL